MEEITETETESMEEAVEPESETLEDSLLVSVDEISPEDIPEGVSEEAEAAVAEETGVSVLESGTCGANLTWTFD
ncbi:MAG: hypothetical protein LUF30_11380 [Lachnospiraceae bacterium]|nr:hypothetical protein [Lachnospiraceae bacterium]